MEKFKIGDMVETTEGSMQHIPGTVVYLDQENEKYLVRFGGSQQMYYAEDEIVSWGTSSS